MRIKWLNTIYKKKKEKEKEFNLHRWCSCVNRRRYRHSMVSMLSSSNEDEYVCSNSMDHWTVESKLGIAMVCNPYAYEGGFLSHIFDCKPKWNSSTTSKSNETFTLPQKRHRCALRCRPSLSNDVNSSACVPSRTLILYDETSFEENEIGLGDFVSSIFGRFLIGECWGTKIGSVWLASWHWSRRTWATKTLR